MTEEIKTEPHVHIDPDAKLPAWWVSWYGRPEDGAFTMYNPWWVTGYASGENDEYDAPIFVAAIRAANEDAVWEQISEAYDVPPEEGLNERFCEQLEEDRPLPWEHRDGRFSKADWMEWD